MYAQWKEINKSQGDFKLNLDLSINKGELVTLLGPSGCGKTTALRIAAGFISPDSGEFILDNEVLNGISPSKRNIGIVFQNYALFPHMNVEENISYGLKNKNIKKQIVKEEVEYILKSLHLSGYNKRDVSSLSGGEKQRVALGRSLAVKPRLLLLDEPLSALDAELRKKLRNEIKAIQREFNITTLYVTHDQEEALAVSDKVALLKDGQLQQFSIPEELYNNPENSFSGEFIGESNVIEVESGIIFFRPEKLRSGHNSNAINFTGDIIHKEFLGHFSRGILHTHCNKFLKIISYDHFLENKYHVLLKDTLKIKK